MNAREIEHGILHFYQPVKVCRNYDTIYVEQITKQLHKLTAGKNSGRWEYNFSRLLE